MMISDDIFAQIKNKFPFLGNSSDYAIQFILELKLSRIDAITHSRLRTFHRNDILTK